MTTNDSFQSPVPLRYIGLCGVGGVLVDFFSGLAILTNGPGWLHALEALTTILLTIIIVGVVTYSYFRHNRTRASAEH